VPAGLLPGGPARQGREKCIDDRRLQREICENIAYESIDSIFEKVLCISVERRVAPRGSTLRAARAPEIGGKSAENTVSSPAFVFPPVIYFAKNV